ncbi:MAG: TIGR02530 family flagellar biosynthesis protein [Bacteriovoracia bacterium]
MSKALLYPAIGGAPGTTPSVQRDPAQAPDRGSESKVTESFDQILGSELTKPISEPLKFSAHATSRVNSRKVNVGPEQMRKLNEAVEKAAAKGLDDTLILTKDAAFIVNVRNRIIVTAMDRSQLEGNVFTNIDGTVVI